MTTEHTDRPNRSRARTVAAYCWRVFADLLLVGLWVCGLTVVFLATGWPRWAFYLLVLLGILGYTTVTGR